MRISPFEKYVTTIFRNLKNEVKDSFSQPVIPVFRKKKFLGILRVVSKSSLETKDEIKNLAQWRKQHEDWFPSQFTVTLPGTKKWTKKQLLSMKDRILFMIETPSGIPVGHVGLYRFIYNDFSCEIDNVIRGNNLVPGIMTYSLKTLINWTFSTLGVKTLYLKVLSDNVKAINLYKRCGFKEVKKIPLKRKMIKGISSWIEQPKDVKGIYSRYHLQMILNQKNKKIEY